MNKLSRIQDGLHSSLKLLHSRVMPDNAMALAIEYRGEIVVTRVFMTDLVGFLHHTSAVQQTQQDRNMGIEQRQKLKMEIFTKDWYVLTPEQYDELTYHRQIPQYSNLQLEKK